jgi:hypothetical protein
LTSKAGFGERDFDKEISQNTVLYKKITAKFLFYDEFNNKLQNVFYTPPAHHISSQTGASVFKNTV